MANTGSSARITQTCTIVDAELFAQFKAIADGAQRDRKLLADVLKQLKAIHDNMLTTPQQVVTAPNGIAIGNGSIVTNPTVNNTASFGAPQPPPHVTWIQDAARGNAGSVEGTANKNPGLDVIATVANTFSNPMFIVNCDKPCVGTDVAPINLSGGFSPNIFSSNSQKSAIMFVVGPVTGFIPMGTKVRLRLKSADDHPITVMSVGACIWSSNPGDPPGSARCWNGEQQ